MFGPYGFIAKKDLYRITPAMTWDFTYIVFTVTFEGAPR